MSDLLLQPLRYLVLAALAVFLYRVARAMRAEFRQAPPPQAAMLMVEEGGADMIRGQVLTLTSGAIVGRSSRAQVVVPDRHVSDRHARLVVRNGRFWVEDLGSTNGTYVNGLRVSGPAPLNDGDRLGIGGIVLRFSWGALD